MTKQILSVTGAVLWEGEAEDTRDALQKAVAAGADLAGADLARASLARANLAGADLAGANLARAYLARADLAGANLAGAYLARADLAGADLARANLARAYLASADLAGAYLAGAYLAGADEVIDAGYPNGWLAYGWRKEGAVMVQVGCQSKTLADGRDYWRGKDDRREVMAALDYIEAVARIRGWIATEKEPSSMNTAVKLNVDVDTRTDDTRRRRVSVVHAARTKIVEAHAREAMSHLAALVGAYDREQFEVADAALLDTYERLRALGVEIDHAIDGSGRPELAACRTCGARACNGHEEEDVGF